MVTVLAGHKNSTGRTTMATRLGQKKFTVRPVHEKPILGRLKRLGDRKTGLDSSE